MIFLNPDSWEVKSTGKRGRGIFATKDIKPGIIVGDYLGKVLRNAEIDVNEKDDGLYLMYYHDYASIYPIDISAAGIHLINHSCFPNCWMFIYRGHTLFFTLRKIFKGEELTISYLLSPIDELCKPCLHECLCGNINCIKTMHLTPDRYKKWTEFKALLANQTKRARIRYGKSLPKLAVYPKNISDNPIYSLFGSFAESSLSLNNSSLPSHGALRKLVRETGRRLEFPNLKTRVLGVIDDEVVSEVI